MCSVSTSKCTIYKGRGAGGWDVRRQQCAGESRNVGNTSGKGRKLAEKPQMSAGTGQAEASAERSEVVCTATSESHHECTASS